MCVVVAVFETSSDCSQPGGSSSLPWLRKLRCRNRWLLAFTLIRNPQLKSLRRYEGRAEVAPSHTKLKVLSTALMNISSNWGAAVSKRRHEPSADLESAPDAKPNRFTLGSVRTDTKVPLLTAASAV